MNDIKPRGKIEKRAYAACQEIHAQGYGNLRIEWRKSREYGRCPAVLWNGEKAAHAGGCGYDKESAVLTEFLCWLPGFDCSGCSGAGVRTLTDRLAGAGWQLVHIYNGKAEDEYTISRIAPKA